MLSASRSSESGSYRGRFKTVCESIVFALMFISPLLTVAPQATSDPGVMDNGDYTKSVLWNFTDSSSYSLYNTSVSGGLGSLELVNETVSEDSTAQYLNGTGTNIDLQEVPGGIVIDNSTAPVQQLLLQPGPEGKDNYLDEWFPWWSPPEGGDLEIDCNYDPGVTYNRRSSIIMEFNLSLIPAGATIVDATLQLYEKGGKASTISYTIHAVTKVWEEIGVSWMTRDVVRNWDMSGGDYSAETFASGTINGVNEWKSFDLSRLVDLWTRGTIPNYGFIIVPDPANLDGLKTFTDCETTNKVEQRPKLFVNYTLGNVSGTYESRALGPATNATFTLASWTDGFVSKATEEFDDGNISPMWMWTNDPSLAGGSVNFDRPGWFNITGSQPTDLTDTSIGCNYLHQDITGNFQAEASLQTYFTAESMGAGIMINSGVRSWLAIYLAGIQGNNSIVVRTYNGSETSTLASIPWNDTSVHLRIDRNISTYQLLASADGINWITVATCAPQYDFALRVSAGIFVCSGGDASSPVAEFDFVRIRPVEQTAAF